MSRLKEPRTISGKMLNGPLGTNFNEILIEIQTFSLKEFRLKISSAKCRTFRLYLIYITNRIIYMAFAYMPMYVNNKIHTPALRRNSCLCVRSNNRTRRDHEKCQAWWTCNIARFLYVFPQTVGHVVSFLLFKFSIAQLLHKYIQV